MDQIPELAAELREARKTKPIVSVANVDAASAAYWLGSQASEFYVTPSGQVGSVGVFSAHEDISALTEMEGRKISLVSAGKYKVEGNPFEPLGEEAREEIQRVVDHYYDLFLGEIGKGRNVSKDAVRKGFGQGRMVLAKEAVAEGMVDDIATFDQALSRAMRLASQTSTAGAAARAPLRGITGWAPEIAASMGTLESGAPAPDLLDSRAIGSVDGPYTEHGGRVLHAVQEFAERTAKRKAARLAAGREPNPGDRERLKALADEMRGAAIMLDDLAAAPSDEASQVEAEFLAISSTL